jgi:hypothetical protein
MNMPNKGKKTETQKDLNDPKDYQIESKETAYNKLIALISRMSTQEIIDLLEYINYSDMIKMEQSNISYFYRIQFYFPDSFNTNSEQLGKITSQEVGLRKTSNSPLVLIADSHTPLYIFKVIEKGSWLKGSSVNLNKDIFISDSSLKMFGRAISRYSDSIDGERWKRIQSLLSFELPKAAYLDEKNILFESVDRPITELTEETLSTEGLDVEPFEIVSNVRISGNTNSEEFTFFLWTWVKCLNLLEGVECEIQEIKKGSWIIKFLIKCKDLITSKSTKKLLLETVSDLAKGSLASYTKGGAEVDKIKSESAKGNAEADRIIKETEALPDSEEAKELRDLQKDALKLELEEKKAEIEAKKIANAKARIDMVKDIKEMMKEAILAVDEITMDIEGVPILIKKGNDITAPQSIEGSA